MTSSPGSLPVAARPRWPTRPRPARRPTRPPPPPEEEGERASGYGRATGAAAPRSRTTAWSPAAGALPPETDDDQCKWKISLRFGTVTIGYYDTVGNG